MARLEMPVSSFIGLILVLIPLPNHWRARNISTLALIFWLAFLDLYHFVNSIIWSGSTQVRAVLYCDIFTKLNVGAPIGIHIAAFCIIRQLESIASGRTGIQTARDRSRRRLIDAALCVGLPCLVMALHYIVQGHRFDILEDFGCFPSIYWSWPALIINILPPLIISLLGFIYGSLTIYWFLQRRSQFNDLLTTSGSGVSRSRYMRLMGLSFAVMIIATAAEIFSLVSNVNAGPLRPYDSWADVHSNWLRIRQIARVLLTDSDWAQWEFILWLGPIASLCFFIFFGMGDEAIADYVAVFDFIRVKVLRMKPRQPKGGNSQFHSGLPSIKLPKGFSANGGSESYDLEAKFPNGSQSEAAPSYSKHMEATASRLSVPITMTDGSFGRVSPTATQFTVSDRASVALSYDEGADEDDISEDFINNPTQHPTSTSTSPTNHSSSPNGDNAV